MPRRVRLWSMLTVLCLLPEAAFHGLIPLSLGWFIDQVLLGRDISDVYAILGLLGAGLVIALAAGLLRDLLAARTQSAALSGLREAMFGRLQRQSMANPAHSGALYPHDGGTGLLDRFAADLAVIENAVSMAVPWGLLPLLQAVLTTALMLWLDMRAGLLGVLLWPWVLLAPRAALRQASRANSEVREQEEQVLGTLRENLSAQTIIRAFSLERAGLALFRRRNELLSRSMMRAGFLASFMERFTEGGLLFVQAGLLGLCAWLTFQHRMTLGAMAALQMLAITLSNSLFFLVEYLPALSDARHALRRLQAMLDGPRAVEDADEPKLLPPLDSEIVFAGVHFSYAGEQEQLSGIRLRIAKGSYVGLVGPSGSGKSTMLKLLMRFYDPSRGLITIDGHDLRQVTQASLRARMGVVLQDNALFNISVRDNILAGQPGASADALKAAVRTVGLEEAIAALPQGYDTLLGEQGVRLPAAVQQRLALARAILREPEILLLDEATSALDAAEEAALSQTIRAVRQGRTTIAVSHRLATVADADQLYVFENGRIAEQGSHFELIAAGGVYATLWRKQAGFNFSPDGHHVDVDARRLKAFPILDQLRDDQLSELAPFFATETFPAGREIVRQNDPGDKFYIIARGKVEVWRMEEQSGHTRRMAVLQDGDFFGEITLITGFPRTASVRAQTVCTCISLERGQFNRLLERVPELKQRISEVALQRLRESSHAVAASTL